MALEFTAKPRQWGNSLGITIPKSVVDELHLHGGEGELSVSVKKKGVDLSSLRGKFILHKSAQELKNEMRDAWE
jgi:antitoxin component of MazEF toxin-antitoxin module